MNRIKILILGCILFGCTSKSSILPNTTSQLILAVTDSISSTKGKLYLYNRVNSNEWEILKKDISIVVGRNGLAWGIGLHEEENKPGYSQKREGDGRSPAGIFYLSAVFGYDLNQTVNMPFIHVDNVTECVDDVTSRYYNQVLKRTDLPEIDLPEWESSEKMWEYGKHYEQGVIVNHNVNPIEYGKGSCIFLHNWIDENDVTAGCTAMDAIELAKVIQWLDSERNPILVQLSKETYFDLKAKWNLPDL